MSTIVFVSAQQGPVVLQKPIAKPWLLTTTLRELGASWELGAPDPDAGMDKYDIVGKKVQGNYKFHYWEKIGAGAGTIGRMSVHGKCALMSLTLMF